ncbi:plastin-2-like [Acanthaster planci]|uniref:Plastin-2-like n=1 Tax=Acanthaster planci TaxID=133434 RepID=A0A8B7YF79_ACAPL|nr:plastin-2-like [Acanthaster planci]
MSSLPEITESLTAEELEEIRVQFDAFDQDENGRISVKEIGAILQKLGESVPAYKIRDIISAVDKDKNGTVEFSEFLEMYTNVKSQKVNVGLFKVAEKAYKLQCVNLKSPDEGQQHSYDEPTKVALVEYINKKLENDEDVKAHLPIDKTTNDLFNKVSDGILICKIINLSVPNTVDERALNKGKLNAYVIMENTILALNSARAIGCNVVNIDPQDIVGGVPHLVLDLLWQIVYEGLVSHINLESNPYLLSLLNEGETQDELIALSPEEILIRWVNYHLKRAGSTRLITNLGNDLQNSEIYGILLLQIGPAEAGITQIVSGDPPLVKAKAVLANAARIKCDDFVTPEDVVSGNENLNMAFVANLFHYFPALQPPDEEFENVTETREERTFRNWMNSLGVSPRVYWLYGGLKNGLILLQLLEKVKPGIVNWSKVNRSENLQPRLGWKMKMLENCNYVVELCHQLRFSLVGIGGEDIFNGTKTLVLAIVWQMLRQHVLSALSKLSGSDSKLEDKEIIEWINNKLQVAGKASRISNFKDPSIADAKVVLELVDAIKVESVKWSLVSQGITDEEKLGNARYAVSMARKIGASVYIFTEDILEVKPKMLLTLFASLMAVALKK